MSAAGQSGSPAPNAGAGGEGGADSSDEESKLGTQCDAPGALACAGAHQKVTLICSGDGKWEAHQTCSSGQFCSSTSGPDLGLCKAPRSDCVAREPGETFCAADAKTLMQCDLDGISGTQVENCDARCIDGMCAAAPPCPDNIVYSCDPSCPGPNTSPSCFNLCPAAASGISPLLDVSDEINGTRYAVALPAVPADSQPCSCVDAKGALKAVAFRIPSPSVGYRWKVTYPPSWTLHYYGDTEEEKDDYKKCQLPWPFMTSATSGCTLMYGSAAPAKTQVWLSATAAVAEPGAVLIELLPQADAKCAP